MAMAMAMAVAMAVAVAVAVAAAAVVVLVGEPLAGHSVAERVVCTGSIHELRGLSIQGW